MENYTYTLKPEEIQGLSRLPVDPGISRDMINLQYTRGITELVKAIYSLLTSGGDYTFIVKNFDYSNGESTENYRIYKEDGMVKVQTPENEAELYIDESEDLVPQIELFVGSEIIQDYFVVVSKITRDNLVIYDKIKGSGTRIVANPDRQKFYPGVECPICLNALDTQQPVCVITPCNHVLHCGCLDNLLNHEQTYGICPTCRTGIMSIETVSPEEIARLGNIQAPPGYVAPPPRVVPGGTGFGKTKHSLNKIIKYLLSL
jgi:hypothetical protein